VRKIGNDEDSAVRFPANLSVSGGVDARSKYERATNLPSEMLGKGSYFAAEK